MPDMEKWKTGVFDCCDDCSSCCMVIWCPCVAHGMIDNGVSGGGECAGCFAYFCLGAFAHCCLSPSARYNLRKKYALMESPCGDCCAHLCCHTCAQCQEIRELKARGALRSAAKPNHVGPRYSNGGPAAFPTSPTNQQLLPHYGPRPVPAAAAPEYERISQAPMPHGLYPPNGHPQQQPYGVNYGNPHGVHQAPSPMQFAAPPGHPAQTYPQNPGYAPQYGAPFPVPSTPPLPPKNPEVVQHYPLL